MVTYLGRSEGIGRVVFHFRAFSFSTLLLGFFAIGLTADPALSDEGGILGRIEVERAAILNNSRPSVVRIHSLFSNTSDEEGLQLGRGFTHGTGFFFDDNGHILTVQKAVQDAEAIWVTLANGFQTRATFLASDPASEIAVLRVDVAGNPSVRLGNSERVKAGHYAFILGNIFGNLTPAFGISNGVDGAQDLIHVTAPVHPGFGGAPVFCSTGEVIGMVWAAPDPWSGMHPEGTNVLAWQEIPTTCFVVPINRAIRIAKGLISGPRFAYGWLGAEGDFDPERGFQVTKVLENSPAEASGIREGDLVVAYNGKPVLSGEHLRSLVLATPPGTFIQIKIKRGNENPATPDVEVGQMPEESFAQSLGPGRTSVTAGAFQTSAQQEVIGQIDRLQQELSRLKQQYLKHQQ